MEGAVKKRVAISYLSFREIRTQFSCISIRCLCMFDLLVVMHKCNECIIHEQIVCTCTKTFLFHAL